MPSNKKVKTIVCTLPFQLTVCPSFVLTSTKTSFTKIAEPAWMKVDKNGSVSDLKPLQI